MEQNELRHHGVKGQKWGVRRYQNADGSLTAAGKKRYGDGEQSSGKSEADAQKRAQAKKIIAGVAVGVTLAAATTLYLKNKDTVDKFVKQHGGDLISTVKKTAESASQKKVDADRAYAQAHKASILKSASKLNRYKDYFDDKEVQDAISKLRQTRDLHQLSQDNIQKGAKYASALLAYATAATTAYNLKNSQLAKDAEKIAKKPKPKDKG